MDDLSSLSFFRPFPGSVLTALATVARWRGFGAGQIILEAGDPAPDIFFIASGEVRIILGSSGGQEVILNELGPGQFFGEIAAIDGGPRSAGVVALTRCHICVIAAEPFMGFALSTPEASLHVMKMLARLVREKDARLLELTVLPVRPRLIALLLRMARPHAAGGLVVSPRRPHHELAALVGTGREVVSRTLSALQRDGLVTAERGGLLLPEPMKLKAEVEAGYRAARSG